MESPDPNLTDTQLLTLATEEDPDLLEPFRHDLLKLNRDFGHAVILVCTSDGKKGLLEDAGCTAEIERHLWKQDVACQFTISASKVCGQ